MTILTETRERFLLAITAQIPPDRIAEIHFFPPIKQGGIESGVAVAAAWPEPVLPPVESVPPDAAIDEPIAVVTDAELDITAVESAQADEIASGERGEPDEIASEERGEPDEIAFTLPNGIDTVDAAESAEADAAVAVETSESDAAPAAEVSDITDVAAPTREVRPVIYMARYRLILKGLDRGKWDTAVFAEADAPLVTVDAVVRGVQRRSGDADDATRMEGDDVRAFVAARAARTQG